MKLNSFVFFTHRHNDLELTGLLTCLLEKGLHNLNTAYLRKMAGEDVQLLA